MATRVEPDLKFVDNVIQSGGDSLKKCFQCATCSVVCSISPEKRPFPRKEMIWAQWGLKGKLIASPDVWLCHQCNDCSTNCPRSAKPGDVLAAVRKQSLIEYATPKFFARWVSKAGFLPLLFLIPVVLLALALALRIPLNAILLPAFNKFDQILGLHEHVSKGMEYANLFPHWLLIGFFTLFTGLAMLFGIIGIIRFWKDMHTADNRAGNITGTKGLIPSIIKTIIDVLTHNKFSGCTATKSRFLSHFGIFYGFIGLLIVTAWAIIVLYITKGPYPFNFLNPMKLFGNISGLALIGGCCIILYNRTVNKDDTGKSTNFDWTFVIVLLSVAITGFITQFLRFGQVQAVGYAVYFIHLVCVFFLLVYLPYSKFAHVLYRTVAMIYAEYTGRNDAVEEKK
jgi:quinone-modifying oxidoreductase subunit QmoC